MSTLPETVRKKLPVGMQTLSQIIQEGFYYVDKTGFAQRLIARGKYYFLSRPRRFGKSLFLDTLKEIFEGNQALFAGLAIHDQWDWSQRFHVLRISFAGRFLTDTAELTEAMHQQLEQYERQFDLPARYPDNPARFRDLIARLHQKTGQGVVILIDEYDKPILDQIDQQAIVIGMRDDLKDFYSVIKDLDGCIRFVLFSGVSRFSKSSLFFDLDNLIDITLNPAYSALCGFTEAELDTVFAPELEGLDREAMRLWYKGHNWLGEAVYNPSSCMLFFSRREIHNWWFESGTPSFLIKLLASGRFFTADWAGAAHDGELITGIEEEQIMPEALLFQTGYLTIREARQLASGTWRYTLACPNREVAVSLNSRMFARYGDGFRKIGLGGGDVESTVGFEVERVG
jgi:Predicted AAA-ATPase